jgi:hypothetical protein
MSKKWARCVVKKVPNRSVSRRQSTQPRTRRRQRYTLVKQPRRGEEKKKNIENGKEKAQIDTEKESQKPSKEKYRHGQVKGIYKNRKATPTGGPWGEHRTEKSQTTQV